MNTQSESPSIPKTITSDQTHQQTTETSHGADLEPPASSTTTTQLPSTVTPDSMFTPLPPNSIRLLRLCPGFVTSPVECELVTINIDEAPTYDALSYVWGAEDSNEPITCSSHQVSVKNNLLQALRHLRPLPEWVSNDMWPKSHALHSSHNAWKGIAKNRHEMQADEMFQQNLLWVDSLCINQADTTEREEQVKLMGRIYSHAETVKVWLGPADTVQVAGPPRSTESAPTASDALLTVSSVFARPRPVYHLLQYGNMPLVLAFIAQALRNVRAGENPLGELRPPWDLVYKNKTYGLLRPSAEEWRILRQFFANVWFDRTWVVQEIVLAKQAVVMVGDWQLEWSALGQAAAWFEDHGYGMPMDFKFSREDRKDLLPVTKPAALWRMYDDAGKRWPLLQMLRDLRGRNATDGRDKLYATYSMAQETASHDGRMPFLLEPTYAKASGDQDSCQYVYRDATRFLIIQHGDLSILSQVEQTRVLRTGKWPSWVPDWRQAKLSMDLAGHYPDIFHYNASASRNMVIGDSLDPNCLALQGIRITTVQRYSERLSTYKLRHVIYQDECQFVESAWKLYAMSPDESSQPTREDLDALISTLCAGVTDECKPIQEDPAFIRDARAWLAENAPQVPRFHGAVERWFGAKYKGQRHPGRFQAAYTQACSDRAFFITSDGMMGIGPKTIGVGDVIVVLFGGVVPYALRGLGESSYSFIGECYIHGLMKGEVMEKLQTDGCALEMFNLV